MNRLYLILIFSVSILFVQAQSELTMRLNKEGKIVAVPAFKPKELTLPAYSLKIAPAATTVPKMDLKFKEFVPQDKLQIEEYPMSVQVLSSAYKPFFDLYSPMKRRMSPMAFDFTETSITDLNENLALVVHGGKSTWPGLGGMTTINPTIVWSHNKWTISGGVLGGSYYSPFQLSPNTMVGANTRVAYQATDWLKLNAWGQYIDRGESQRKNPFVSSTPLYNQTNIGGTMEIKLTESFGVGVGAQREFNVMRRKWETYPIFFPIFYGK